MKDFFEELYYVKKAMLMSENIFDGYSKTDEVFAVIKPELAKVKNLTELTALAGKYFNLLKADIPQFDDWNYSDYEVYTDKFHHRKFWNEIENHESIEVFLEKFLEIFDAQDEPQNFSISLYDFNDYNIIFANENDLNSFICNFDVAPYTVFEHKDGVWVEMYSA